MLSPCWSMWMGTPPRDATESTRNRHWYLEESWALRQHSEAGGILLGVQISALAWVSGRRAGGAWKYLDGQLGSRRGSLSLPTQGSLHEAAP